MVESFIQFRGINKSFGGIAALVDVSFGIARGECHGLMGENGAGKSTLGKVLAGIHRPDSGTIRLNDQTMQFRRPADALAAGIGMVHQELAFCADLSVAENLCMGVYPRRFGLFLDRNEMRRRAAALLARIDVHLDVDRMMKELNTAQEQLVQIAAAVGTGAAVLVFDEPTSSLSEVDAQQLFKLIEQLKSTGTTIVYVSHRMPELFRLCDRISVLRDGRYVGTVDRAEATQDKVVQMMIGRQVQQFSPRHLQHQRGDVRLSVRKLSSQGKFDNIDFEVRAGEVVGFAGLVGAGRSEVATAIFGLDSAADGEVRVDSRSLQRRSIHAAKHAGIGLLPEDRKRQGLVLSMSCVDNFSLAMLRRMSRLGFFRRRLAAEKAGHFFQQLRLKTSSVNASVATLSGGNQQKVAFAKWLARDCKVLILDEPTRGVDVGAKASIHQLIDELAIAGIAVMLISSELPEVISLSTRVLVMRQGKIVADVPRAQASQETILRHMSAVKAA